MKVIIVSVTSVVCLAIWFGLFFGLNYPEIRINTDFKPAQCSVTSNSLSPYTCCFKTCSGCSECGLSPSCNSLQNSLQPGVCCDGYYCCSTCCDTCQDCTKTCDSNGKNCHKSCTSYDCNCRCCYSVYNLACRVDCYSCFRTHADVSYSCTDSTDCCSPTDLGYSSQDLDCQRNLMQCVDFQSYWGANTSFPCWYDPIKCGSIVRQQGYTWWKWFLMSFPTIFILAGMMGGSYFAFTLLSEKFDRKRSIAIAAWIFMWFVILYPLLFFLPLREATGNHISEGGKIALLVIVLIMVVLALSIIGILLLKGFLSKYFQGSERYLSFLDDSNPESQVKE